jgi:release factor family 3
MMSEFSREELKALVEEQIPPCVSIYMPTVQQEGRLREDESRFRNLLREAEDRLLESDVDREGAEQILGPARQLLEDRDFWDERREGVALFLSASPDAFRVYSDTSAAIQFDGMVRVANRFYVKPLLPLLTGDGQFYVLTLSERHIGLLKGTRDQITPLELKGVARSLEEALGIEMPGRAIQGRPMNVGGGEQTGVFGGYDPDDDQKERLQRYFRVVNDGIHKVLADRNEPLVLAGIDYYLGMYRAANTYPHLVEEGIPGNQTTMSTQDLHQQAWKIVEPRFVQERLDAVDRYRRLINTSEQASNRLAEILPAAQFGRVATLFVTKDQQQFGTFDPNTGRLEVHNGPRPENVDLLDEAATQTILNGGIVYVLPQLEMPDTGALIAAIYRY